MAFLRVANALVVKPEVSLQGWRKNAGTTRVAGAPNLNLTAQASEILGQNFDPSKYLLTHCTIVSSVDTETVPNVKLGTVVEQGKHINRKYSNFRITPETDKYINHNLDSWDRKVLLKAYKTFIGAQNFCEHVQVEELSKGRILDAVIRDVGESLYVDILVATDRKHTQLVADIISGKLSTLSMGCSVEETTCTHCGNTAPDETTLCDHIRFYKGNQFIDEYGKSHRNAELCGHHTIEPTGGVTFIEASWVATPAFTGAVLRNIIDPANLTETAKKQAQKILSEPPPQWVEGGRRKGAAMDFGDMGGEEESGAAEEKPKENVFDKLENDILSEMAERVKNRITQDLSKKKEAPEAGAADSNNSIQKSAALMRNAYRVSLGNILKYASNPTEVIKEVARLDRSMGVIVPIELYKVAHKVSFQYGIGHPTQYMALCKQALKRKVSETDQKHLIRLGKVLLLSNRSKHK